MPSLKIILLCIFSAIVYGILHDQVTARVCVEYFTVAHAPIFGTESPTLLAFGWGVLATWWVGLILGIAAAVVCRVGRWPKVEAVSLVRPIAGLLIVIAVASLLAGITGYQLAKDSHMVLPEPYASLISEDRHWLFYADSLAHAAAYLVGALGGVGLCVRVVGERRRMSAIERGEDRPPRSPDYWLLLVCRWTARTISVPLLGLIIALAVGEGLPNPLTASMRENLLHTIVLMMLAGLVVGWKREGWGGLLILGGLALFAIVNRGLLLNIVMAPWLVAGLLYLASWWMARRVHQDMPFNGC
ncbi:MAG: hypothetical protein PVH19_09630 [Planctomycetia bacterium]|jgi:hypothetical protein